MSRIGKTPIQIPDGVTLESGPDIVTVKGPKGTLTVLLPSRLSLNVDGKVARVEVAHMDRITSSLHGLTRTLVANAIVGVTKGWEKTVELVGVGFRATGAGKQITLTVGFSHPVNVTAPDGISFTIADNKITVSGIDKKDVGEVAANLRKIRPPEPYKGKGIRYLGEVVRKKAGKAVKAAGAA